MPFVSRAQQRWGNSPAGKKALGDVAEWNAITPKNLPERKGKTSTQKSLSKLKRGMSGKAR